MRFCNECGAQIEDGNRFCTVCGALVVKDEEEATESIIKNEMENFMPSACEETQKQQETMSYSEPVYSRVEEVPNKPSKGITIAGMILGIASIALSWLGIYAGVFGIIPLACSIVGLVLSCKSVKKKKSGMGIAGLVCSIIGLVLSVLFIIGGIRLICVLTHSNLASF